jgi:DNA helicase-2/ATP-dependent DNA helicase PcrA
MPDWSALRRRAYTFHVRLRAQIPGEDLLVPADILIRAAAKMTGVRIRPVASTDPLLAGAHAFLDRQINSIWYAANGSLPQAQLRLILAHEFGHYWLHPDVLTDTFDDADVQNALSLIPDIQSIQIAEGYSPAERRESEATTFAAEFLLPTPLLRRTFLELGWNATRIAAHVGLSEACVLDQLTQCLRCSSSTEAALPSETEEPPQSGSRGFDLDRSQEKAARIETGPVLVDAGPGTGKTRTLIARILYLLDEHRIEPERILALTFSNRAAEEMRSRLRDIVGYRADRVWMGTFHAFGMELLRKEGHALGLPVRPRLIEVPEAVALLESHLDRLNLREFEYLHQPSLAFPDLLRCVSRAKDELKTPEDYLALSQRQREQARDETGLATAHRSEEIARFYAVYQNLLQEQGLLDFGDLLMRSVLLLDGFPEVRARWQQQFPQLLADEYQDINRASAQLLQRLAGEGKGLWAVGDLRQAIYRFRGASPANVREFEHDFPGGRRLRLEINYRSRTSLVSLFSAFAQQMEEATLSAGTQTSNMAQWEARRLDSDGSPLTLATADHEEAQADGLAASIREMAEAGIGLRDQAILCTTNAQASDLAKRLEKRGIATQHLGSLFERSEIKDLLALVSLACEPDGSALARVANFAEYAIPTEDVTRLLEASAIHKRAFPLALELAPDLPELSEAGRTGLMRLWEHLQPIIFRGDAWLLLARYLFETSRYLHPFLASEEIADRQKLLAIYQLLQFAKGLNRRLTAEAEPSPQQVFLDYLRRLMLCGEGKSVRPTGMEELEAVRLMTVHQSKGLEFPVVYLPNLIKGQFPFRRSGSIASPAQFEDRETEEEGSSDDCLFFVALSRARDQLILSSPTQWRRKAAQISPLLSQIVPALDVCGARRVLWTASQESAVSPVAEDAPSIPDGENAPSLPSNPSLPSLTLSALEQYRECPRQFYYQRVVHLPERVGDTTYLAFHDCLQQTQRWLLEERSAGRSPSLEEAHSRLQSVWETQGPSDEIAYARVLRSHADTLLEYAYYSLSTSGQGKQGIELIAELPNGSVSLRCDHAEQMPDGSLRLERHHRRRARKNDHTDERLALLRLAAKQQDAERPVQIVLNYLQNGECREVPESARYEPARVEKYDSALQGIRESRFPAIPDDRRCGQCPFLFICPT